MKKEIKSYSPEDGTYQTMSVETACSCPLCGVSLNPDMLYSVFFNNQTTCDMEKLYILNYCSSCDECFISKHNYDEDNDLFTFFSSAPCKFIPLTFSPAICDLSPDFISIYEDSAHAESLGLSTICGMGYRKSLEYLVKDYCISINPTAAEDISKLPLAKCIEQFIDNPKLKALAKASTWLGNDETHYIKKHPEYGIDQLKTFINAFVSLVDLENNYKEAMNLLDSV